MAIVQKKQDFLQRLKLTNLLKPGLQSLLFSIELTFFKSVIQIIHICATMRLQLH